jgi:hypothetical protein
MAIHHKWGSIVMKTQADIRRATRSYTRINPEVLCENTENCNPYMKKRRRHDISTIGNENNKRSGRESWVQLEPKSPEKIVETDHTNVQKAQIETITHTMYFDRPGDDRILDEEKERRFPHDNPDPHCKISELSQILYSEKIFTKPHENEHDRQYFKGILYSINSDHGFEVPIIKDLCRIPRAFGEADNEIGIYVDDWIGFEGLALFKWDPGNIPIVPISTGSSSHVIKPTNGLTGVDSYSYSNPNEIKLWNVLYRFKLPGLAWLSNPKTVGSLDDPLPSFLLPWQAFNPVLDQLGSHLKGICDLDHSRAFQDLMFESGGNLSCLPHETVSSETPNIQQTSISFSDKQSSSIESFARPLVFHSLMQVPITLLPKDIDISYFDVCACCGSAGMMEVESMIGCQHCGELWHRFCRTDSRLCPRCSVCELCGLHSPESGLIACGTCRLLFHLDCLPSISRPLADTEAWICHHCVRCVSCESRNTQGQWMYRFRLCQSCGLQREQGNFCVACEKVCSPDEPFMVACDQCSSWVHARCDFIGDSLFQFYSSDTTLPYQCPPCRRKDGLALRNVLDPLLVAMLVPEDQQLLMEEERISESYYRTSKETTPSELQNRLLFVVAPPPSDSRQCVFCQSQGDSIEKGRLLFMGISKWAHIGCLPLSLTKASPLDKEITCEPDLSQLNSASVQVRFHQSTAQTDPTKKGNQQRPISFFRILSSLGITYGWPVRNRHY